MVRLIADHWNIRYDADDTDLSTLNEETLNVKATASSPTSKRVSIAQVLEAGLLIAGETLVWERPRKGERWVATVTSEGHAYCRGACRWRLISGSYRVETHVEWPETE